MAVRRVTSGRAYKCPSCGTVGSAYDCATCVSKQAKRAQFAAKSRRSTDLVKYLLDEPRRRVL